MIDLPEKFIRRMGELLGDRLGDYLAALGRAPAKGLHINTVKCDPSVVDAAVDGLGKTSFADNCRFVAAESRPTRHPYYAAGLYYMQEPSAMLPVAALGRLGSGTRVLDMCAAPGGKTSMLACALGGQGLLVSNEIERSRAVVLRENVVRMGYGNTVITSMRPDGLAAAFGEYFDVVVADAPCSGEGMMRKEEEAARNWSEANVRACAARQKEIVRSADACLKRGGTLLYSTCTFSPEEDEEVAGFVISLGYEPIEPPAAVTECGVKCGAGYKFFPHLFDGEGQYFCMFRKISDGTGAVRPKKPYARASAADKRAVGEVADISGLDIAKKDDMLFVPALWSDMPCLANGIMLGRLEKGRFVPAHQLFASMRSRLNSIIDLPLGSDEIGAYLGGAEIAGNARGYCGVAAGGYVLGGGKGSGGVIKNHYPKGLRTKQ